MQLATDFEAVSSNLIKVWMVFILPHYHWILLSLFSQPLCRNEAVQQKHLHFIYLSVNDTLDDILGESGDESEEDAVINQVLDEIGIEISGKVVHILLNLLIP